MVPPLMHRYHGLLLYLATPALGLRVRPAVGTRFGNMWQRHAAVGLFGVHWPPKQLRWPREHLLGNDMTALATMAVSAGTVSGRGRPSLRGFTHSQRQPPRVSIGAIAGAAATTPLAPQTPRDLSGASACRWCGEVFHSRNRMFRHLREAPACATAMEADDPNGMMVLARQSTRQTVLLQVGYLRNGSAAESYVHDILLEAGMEEIELSRASGASSRSSVFHSGGRSSVFEQESSCGAYWDVVAAEFRAAFTGEALMSRLRTAIRRNSGRLDDGSDCIRVLDALLLPPSQDFHAESDCTRRSYRYLVPAHAIEPDWNSAAADGRVDVLCNPVTEKRLYKAMKRLKRTLQSIMATLRCHNDGDGGAGISAGDSLQWWHNYAPPGTFEGLRSRRQFVQCTLQGMKLLRAVELRGVPFVELQINGDHFLTQQCRRLMATVVCIHRGWLPLDYIRISTRRDVVLDTSQAPGHLLLFGGCQFAEFARRFGKPFAGRAHMQPSHVSAGPECSIRSGLYLERPAEEDKWREGAWIDEWHRALVEGVAAAEFDDDRGGSGVSAKWLCELEKIHAPRLRDALADAVRKLPSGTQPLFPCVPGSGCPEPYQDVLRLLRAAKSSGRWPEMTAARAHVVRANTDGTGGTFGITRTVTEDQVPMRGNSEFPELVAAIFELERKVLLGNGRAQASLVAVTHNVVFVPHTDGGSKRGQSDSLIVGLGDYVGGELAVEGVVSDIRYRPLEFNGWQQRHWTLPFSGERFSLVFFSPVRKDAGSVGKVDDSFESL